MVNEVNKIIRNTLVTSGSIYIPEVGTLTIVRVPASSISRNTLLIPSYKVDFSTDNTSESLADIIACYASIPTTEALDICHRWLSKVRSESKVVIEGVGVLHNKSFVINDAFNSMLNPFGIEQVKVTRSRRGIVAIGAMAALLVIGIVGWLSLKGMNTHEQSGDETLIANHTTTAFEQVIDENAIDKTSVPTESSIAAVDNLTESIEADIISQEQGSDDEIVESAEVITDDWREKSDIHHWVVIGSYSTTENAERAIAQLEREHSDLKYKYITLGSMYAVTPYGSSEKSDCEIFAKEYKRHFAQLWIYTPKRYRD